MGTGFPRYDGVGAVNWSGAWQHTNMDYRAAIDRLLTLTDFERKSRAGEPPDFHLRRMELLLASLGDPHLATPVVHVAGSKGKGSTCAMISAALSANGLRTGLYTSPHLHRFTERIRVDGAPVDERVFAGLIERLWPDVAAIEERGDLGKVSVFEMLTAMAFVYFRDIAAECAVIEVGLGGRLDATNLVQPEVSVITPVGLDHVAVLGDTVEKIAAEKAGIIKPGVPVVSSVQQPDAAQVIRQTAAANGSSLAEASSAVEVADVEVDGWMPQRVRFETGRGRYDARLPLLGEHQVENARTAIASLEALESFDLDPDLVSAGLSRVDWPARAQVVDAGPPVVIADGAHSADAGRALRSTLKRHFGAYNEFVLVVGGTAGHDMTAVVTELSDLLPRVIVTQSRHPKAVEPADFAAALQRDNVPVAAVTGDVASALTTAYRIAGPETLIVATGSLFVAAEVIEQLQGIEPELYPDLRGPFTQPYTAGTTI